MKLKSFVIFLLILFLSCSISANEPMLTKKEMQKIYVKGIEFYKNKEYIKAVKEWDKILDHSDVIDSKLKYYYQRAYKKVFLKQKLLKKGMDYYLENNFPEAIVIFKKVLESAPYDRYAQNFLEKSGVKLNEINIATEIKNKISDGDQLYATGQYENALEKYRTVLLLSPDNSDILAKIKSIKDILEQQKNEKEIQQHLASGKDMLDKELLNEAMDEFNTVLHMDPENTAGKNLLQETLFRINQKELAGKLNSIISNGIASYNGEKYQDARNRFNEAVKIDQNNQIASEYLIKIDRYYQDIKQKDILAQQLEDYYIKAVRSFKEMNYEKSREDFLNTFSLDSNYKDVNQYLSRIDQKLEEQRFVKLKEKQDEILEYLNTGISYYQIGEYKSAIYELNKCLELDQEKIFAKEYIDKAKESLYSLSQEEIDEDSPYYEIISKLFEDSSDFYKNSDFEKSMHYLEKITLLFPGNKKAREMMIKITLKLDPAASEKFLSDHYELAMNLYKNKDFEPALKEFSMILSIKTGFKNTEEFIAKINEKKNKQPVITVPLEFLKKYYQDGLVFYSQGKYELAKKEWEKVLADNSDQNIFRLKAIVNLNKIQLKEKYNAELEKSVSKKNNQTGTSEIPATDEKSNIVKQYYLKGIAFYMNGEYKKALEEWQQGLKIDPNNAKLKNNISKCRLKLNSQNMTAGN